MTRSSKSFDFRLAACPSRIAECQSAIGWLAGRGSVLFAEPRTYARRSAFHAEPPIGVHAAEAIRHLPGAPASKKRRRGASAVMQLTKIFVPSWREVNRVMCRAQICNRRASDREAGGNLLSQQNVALHVAQGSDR